MNTTTISTDYSEPLNASQEDIKEFYNEATDDYSFWSKDFNMHFGYCVFAKTNPFKRDTMLNQMNAQILKRLQLASNKQCVADLGCGMGGTMRYFLKNKPQLSMLGVTLSDFQVSEGNKLLNNLNGVIVKEDFCNTTIPSNSLDGAVAIESFSHTGHNYSSFKEAYRVLKPGKRIVVSDAFLKKDPSELCLISKYGYKGLCKGWSLDGLGVIDHVKKDLESIGYRKIVIEDVSLRVAISVLHVPFAIPSFILKNILKGKPIKKQSWNNLKGSFYALLSGLHMKDFGYYIITAEK